MKNIRIASIIVSAGYSSRMGDFKPLLKFGENTAIETVVNTHKDSGIKDIIVVTGYRGSEVAEKLKESGVRCIQNENYSNGMFSSVIEGIKAVDTNVSAFFMHPVDVPLVKKNTIEKLKDKYMESGKGVIYPEFRGKMGHPPLIDCKIRKAILNSNGEGGLKNILKKYIDDSIFVPVFDKAILMDMDKKEDYNALLGYFNTATPDMEECYSILDIYKVPENIIRHCRVVSIVSLKILHSLKNAGGKHNEAALKAAAMLHDIAKKEKNHAQAGEKILKEIGYSEVGSIIGSHTDIEVVENISITENEILYLADKLVKEDKVMTIEERFEKSLIIYKDNPEALINIENRRDAACKIIKKIEKLTGKGFIYG